MRHGKSITKPLAYTRSLFAPEDEYLASIAAAMEARNMAIQIGPEEGRMLQMFLQMNRAKKVLEVGTLAGYSALWMARALPDNGHIFTLERDHEHAAMAKQHLDRAGMGHKVTIIEGPALETLPAMAQHAPFDAMFIDADKPSYPAYLDWAEKLVRKGGIIVGDNTFLFGTVYEESPPAGVAPATWRAMRAFNLRLSDSAKYCGVILPTEEGMTVAVKLF